MLTLGTHSAGVKRYVGLGVRPVCGDGVYMLTSVCVCVCYYDCVSLRVCPGAELNVEFEAYTSEETPG